MKIGDRVQCYSRWRSKPFLLGIFPQLSTSQAISLIPIFPFLLVGAISWKQNPELVSTRGWINRKNCQIRSPIENNKMVDDIRTTKFYR